MNWNMRVLSLMLVAVCTWVLVVPGALANIPHDPSSPLIGIDAQVEAPSLTDISAVAPLEPVDPTPETETANKIAEPGSIGLVALMALMGGGAMFMRRRLG